MKYYIVLLSFFVSFPLFAQKFTNLAMTPPMGWNSWNKFGCDVDENLIRETADAMVSSGMKDAGYQYIVIDDCWHGERDRAGFIQPDPQRFPTGMKALADYIHSKGLKFGIYSDAGWRTCGGRPGSRGYEYQDALQYAKWGVDYLKYDWCNTDELNAKGAYLTMRDALYAAGRPIVFSLCEWGTNRPWEWAASVGHLWRISGDIAVLFDGVKEHGSWKSWGVMQILEMREGIRQHAGPDHWNDFDMMQIGNGMSLAEDRAHFSLWCMMASPLMAGNDLRNMDPATLAILTSREVIAVNQDSLGIQGFRYLKSGDLELWVKPLQNDDLAVCFLNRGSTVMQLEFDWAENSINDDLMHKYYHFREKEYHIRDLWLRRNIGTTKKPLIAALDSHDVKMFRLSLVR